MSISSALPTITLSEDVARMLSPRGEEDFEANKDKELVLQNSEIQLKREPNGCLKQIFACCYGIPIPQQNAYRSAADKCYHAFKTYLEVNYAYPRIVIEKAYELVEEVDPFHLHLKDAHSIQEKAALLHSKYTDIQYFIYWLNWHYVSSTYFTEDSIEDIAESGPTVSDKVIPDSFQIFYKILCRIPITGITKDQFPALLVKAHQLLKLIEKPTYEEAQIAIITQLKKEKGEIVPPSLSSLPKEFKIEEFEQCKSVKKLNKKQWNLLLGHTTPFMPPAYKATPSIIYSAIEMEKKEQSRNRSPSVSRVVYIKPEPSQNKKESPNNTLSEPISLGY